MFRKGVSYQYVEICNVPILTPVFKWVRLVTRSQDQTVPRPKTTFPESTSIYIDHYGTRWSPETIRRPGACP
jgi:hypothetical protein